MYKNTLTKWLSTTIFLAFCLSTMAAKGAYYTITITSTSKHFLKNRLSKAFTFEICIIDDKGEVTTSSQDQRIFAEGTDTVTKIYTFPDDIELQVVYEQQEYEASNSIRVQRGDVAYLCRSAISMKKNNLDSIFGLPIPRKFKSINNTLPWDPRARKCDIRCPQLFSWALNLVLLPFVIRGAAYLFSINHAEFGIILSAAFAILIVTSINEIATRTGDKIKVQVTMNLSINGAENRLEELIRKLIQENTCRLVFYRVLSSDSSGRPKIIQLILALYVPNGDGSNEALLDRLHIPHEMREPTMPSVGVYLRIVTLNHTFTTHPSQACPCPYPYPYCPPEQATFPFMDDCPTVVDLRTVHFMEQEVTPLLLQTSDEPPEVDSDTDQNATSIIEAEPMNPSSFSANPHSPFMNE